MRPFRAKTAPIFCINLRAPEPARERRLADRVALARARVAGRAALAADPRVTLLVTKLPKTLCGAGDKYSCHTRRVSILFSRKDVADSFR